MKIRTKIMLWIIGAGICASIAASAVVFCGMLAAYYEMIDKDLESEFVEISHLGNVADSMDSFLKSLAELQDISKYWVGVYSADQKLLWENPIAKKFKIPRPDSSLPSTFHSQLSPSVIYPEMQEREPLAFRIKLGQVRVHGRPYDILLGKPIEDLGDEIRHSAGLIAVGLAVAILTLLVISRFFATKILKPVNEVIRLTEEISEKTLSQRIPLGKNTDEFYRLSNTLNRMFDRLQHSFDKQKRLLGDTAHELRSPITLLRLQNEERLQGQNLPEEYEAQLVRQQSILHRMGRLINGLLDLSEFEMDRRLNMGTVDLAEMVTSILDDFSELFRAGEITCSMAIPSALSLSCDAEKIHRIMVNLLDNAIKYNRKGGRVEVRAEVAAAGAHVSVFNTGLGIPEKDLPKIFDLFFRAEASRSCEYGGTGLGLTIVKSIVEMHGGQVEAESCFGTWARIGFFLPMKA